ncbi:hypothetical protein DSL72_006183 [Monilinia vaccinii-corymbosi]|uniref:FAD-binding PCMH-type domain-containing protein n=1 Tax=Monilinia vaccinii-corymbosi TaxID=61207 RepID=A0A8A3PHS5_9HELO|nr:hypothetical protein DSL72_006183 [Monilinia vaccinii-corymbosi]
MRLEQPPSPLLGVGHVLIVVPFVAMHRLMPAPGKKIQASPSSMSPNLPKLCESLAAALPDSLILPHQTEAFTQSLNSYWAKQEYSIVPACVVRPRNTHDLCTVITILKHEHDEQVHAGTEKAEGLFAVRSGGILIDLGLFNEAIPSDDGSSVAIGAGNKWMNVSKVLDARGLAVVGGRNSAVGVGGLTLGGGLSFFSPRFGLVCSNIISYDIVLASGTVITASESNNSDLWLALKGGSNNFGIVTRFTAHAFPATKIWSGFLYMHIFQATKVLSAFHKYVATADSNGSDTLAGDVHAAGPIVCFSYIQAIGIQTIAVNLVHTSPPAKKWPACWGRSSFSSLWRIWSTCKVQTVTSATDELNTLNPPGRRQLFATITIKNDPATITAMHSIYRESIDPLRRAKGLVWTLVMQPLLPSWLQKGDPNPLGLGDVDEPLILVSFTVNWDKDEDDELVHTMTRKAIENTEAVAVRSGTAHPYRYMNYCAQWQKPFQGYGEANLRLLQETSKKYDPDGLFQKGCVGGFKLFSDVDFYI